MKHCVLMSVCFLIALSCKKDPAGPPPNGGPDTTSHAFSSWTIDTLGEPGGNSILYDVAIINDTLAYAVGAIYKRDSLGNWDPNAYNLVKWDGNTWELMRIQFYTFCGQSGTGSYPAKSIFAFSGADIWIGMEGSQVVRWNGQSQSAPMCTPVSVNKIWGESPNSVWAVGNNGGIAHFENGTWRRFEIGTGLPLLDIYGKSGTEIYACGSDFATPRGVILKYDGTRWTKLMDSFYPSTGFDSTQLFQTQLYGLITSVWTDDRGSLYAVGDYIYRYRNGMWGFAQGIADNFLYATVFTRGGIHAIRGNASNDFIAAGERTTVLHYNGATGRQVGPMFSFTNSLHLYDVAMKQSHIIAVGSVGGRAGVLRLRR